MAQQTAVNFLYQFVQLKLTHEQQIQYEGLFQQAKEMEKEQITDSYIMGSYDMAAKEFRPEQYYNETYK